MCKSEFCRTCKWGEPDIFLGIGRGSACIKDALEVMTDKWLSEGYYSERTVKDLRNWITWRMNSPEDYHCSLCKKPITNLCASCLNMRDEMARQQQRS